MKDFLLKSLIILIPTVAVTLDIPVLTFLGVFFSVVTLSTFYKLREENSDHE